MDFQTKTIGHLCSLLRQETDPIFLLGAGASAKSGIPLAHDMVEKIAKWGYCLENGSSPDDPLALRSDWYPWLKEQKWYRNHLDPADNYPYAVDNILQPQNIRNEFFRDILNPQVPVSSGYQQMAELMDRKVIRTILTTNFDTILPDWCTSNRRPQLVHVIQTTADFTKISTSPEHPQIIYLHGSVEHYTDKNNLAETEHLDEDLVSMLYPLLRDHPLIVIGYRGAEPSVMKHLLIDHADVSRDYRRGVYWCTQNYEEEDPSSLTPFVYELAGKIGTNFQIVNIQGFDEVIEELWESVRGQQFDFSQKRATADAEKLTSLPYDFQQITESSIDDFEWAPLRTRLVQYCENMDIRVPPSMDDGWIIKQLLNRTLALETKDGNIFPTVGGYLLFAVRPQDHIQFAQVIVRVIGNREWIESVFYNSEDDDRIGSNRTEQTIEGNLWSQLDAVFDILSFVNQPFRLKGEVSTSVQPYPPVALREMVVNALVHRDYTQTEPIVIEIEQTCIRVRNPGGLVPEVVKRLTSVANEEIKTAFEKEIKGGTRGITYCRNRVVADLFYGLDTMEKAGSGLSDVYRSATENRNEVSFGPTDDNTFFEITIHRRPEVVDEITKTAYHSNFIRYASNLLEVAKLPDVIWHAGTNAQTVKEVWENTKADWLPPFIPYARRLFTFHNLSTPTNPLYTQINVNDIQKLNVEEFIDNHGERRFIRLLNQCFYRHLKAQGLWIDKDRKRAYFPRINSDIRAVEYQARVRRATRIVVKRKKRYWEHQSFWFRFENFGNVWTLVLLPSYVFTTDGKSKLLRADEVNKLSTARQSRDYNNVVHNDLVFWAWVLSGGQQSTFVLDLGPTSNQEDSISSNQMHNGNGSQILIKSNLSITVLQNEEAEDALREPKQLAQLESEFSQAISPLSEAADVNPS